MDQYKYTVGRTTSGDEIKICPLTRKTPNFEEDSYDCYELDCSAISSEKWELLHGHRCHCPVERQKIERWFEKQEKVKKEFQRLSGSLDVVRSIDLDEFYQTCAEIDRELIENRQEYNEKLLICPYHEDDEKLLVFLFEHDEVVKISLCENIFSFMSSRFNDFSNKDNQCAISCCSIPAYIAGAVSINLHLKHKLDASKALHYDDPVYISENGMGKYIEAAYGWDWLEFKKIRARHLEMTEIFSGGKAIYIKQELDEIIRREA